MSDPLRLAVPRGTLFEETLDLLDAIGVDSTPLRSDSRSLLFPGPEVTCLTLRPSDVPTYVEAGAVDVGITGKDVLMEQHERVVYELLDLGYGRCKMVVATKAGDRFATRRALQSAITSRTSSAFSCSVRPDAVRSTMPSARPEIGASSTEPLTSITSACRPLSSK